MFTFSGDIVKNAIEALHRNGAASSKKNIAIEILGKKEGRALIGENYRILSDAIDKGFEQYKNGLVDPKDVNSSIERVIPSELTDALRHDAYIFSGFKAYHTLAEAGITLVDSNGGIKPLEAFKNEAGEIFKRQALNLTAEYNHSVHTAQMSAKWNQIESDGDRYDLQYRTAGDDKVREAHRALAGTTLPPSDPFWSAYYPPNGWNCRCTAVQVRKDKYKSTNTSAEAIAFGNESTSLPKQQIFRTNLGKERRLFPKKHPNYPKGCDDCKLKLAFVPGTDKCSACEIVNQCWKDEKKTQRAIERTHYLHEMKPLLSKKVMIKGNGHDMAVSFSKYGNKHLLSDTYGRTRIVQRDDLKEVNKLLDNATFVKKVGLSKERKDAIKRFYYYKADVRGKTVYLNVAETDFIGKYGRTLHDRFLYSITDKLK